MQWEFASALVAGKGWEGKKMVVEADAKVVASAEAIKDFIANYNVLKQLPEIATMIIKYYPSGMTSLEGADYNNISTENIITSPEGENFIRVRQKKTGMMVSIPVKEELRQILVKYNYRLPHMAEQSINSCIKEVAKAAGIDEPVSVETTAGGVMRMETRPKYAMVQSHTARRTAATLMYLAGMDVFNICAVTGHSSIAMLKKYIKADEIDRARAISQDVAFAKW